MRLQKGLILYDPVDSVVLRVLTPHEEPVITELLLDGAGYPPLTTYYRAYEAPARRFWEPVSDALWALYEATEAQATRIRSVTEDAT